VQFEINADVVMMTGIVLIVIDRGWRLIKEMRNGKRQNGCVTYNDLMNHSTTCSGVLHEKINELQKVTYRGLREVGGGLAHLEGKGG
jgi:hypothetical protein